VSVPELAAQVQRTAFQSGPVLVSSPDKSDETSAIDESVAMWAQRKDTR
jgi:hypothetical protein